MVDFLGKEEGIQWVMMGWWGGAVEMDLVESYSYAISDRNY